MTTAWCPECGAEYRDGIDVCADCGVALVAEPPARAKDREVAEHREVTGPFLPDDDLVELTTTHAFEAEVVAAQLRGAGIPAAVFGVGTAGLLSAVQMTEGSRVMVRRTDLDAAETLVADLFESDPSTVPIDDDELAALAEESSGGSDPSTGVV
jgi:uncharacterized Zn finger protein (UPF0148 family)